MTTVPKLRLGDTDVTRIGLGTNPLTHASEQIAFVKEAVAAGVNMIDTAHAYTGGESPRKRHAPSDLSVTSAGGDLPSAVRTANDITIWPPCAEKQIRIAARTEIPT